MSTSISLRKVIASLYRLFNVIRLAKSPISSRVFTSNSHLSMQYYLPCLQTNQTLMQIHAIVQSIVGQGKGRFDLNSPNILFNTSKALQNPDCKFVYLFLFFFRNINQNINTFRNKKVRVQCALAIYSHFTIFMVVKG